MAESRAKGIVKWFSELKGFGFITPHDGGADLFVHQSGIRAEGFRSLAEGEPVEFQVETGSDGRTKAVEVTGPDGAAVQGGRGRGGGYSGGRTQISPNQREGPIPARIKAELPSSNLSCKYRVMRTVMGILSKLSPDNFDHLKGQLIHCVTSADILKGVTSLIFDKAVLEPTFCPMYAQLCSDLSEKLPPFPSDELGGKEITFKRVILNFCQEAFEGADKLREEVRQMTAPEQETERKNKEALIKVRSLGNIQLIGELLKQRVIPEKIVHHIVQELLGQDPKSCPKEENVEAICHFFNTIGKQLDINRNSRRINDVYFNQLKELSSNPQLAPRLRFMVCDVQDLRANNWVPRQEEVKAKTITEIRIEAEKTLGFRPGTTASATNPRDPQGAQGPLSPDGFPLNRPGSNHGKPQSSEDAGYGWDRGR